MGTLNCHCLSARGDTGPMLDATFGIDPRKKVKLSSKADLENYFSTEIQAIDERVSQGCKIYLSRRRARHLVSLQLLERKLGRHLAPAVTEQYLHIGPYQKTWRNSNLEVIKLANESLYLGQSSEEDQFHGYGCLVSTEGGITEGNWIKGILHGAGRMIHPNGDYYEVGYRQGQWSSGIIQGLGKYVAVGGSTYTGEWISGKQCGKGTETWPDGAEYKGDFLNGMKHGKGRFAWADGSEYEGDFLQNNLEGMGRYRWADQREFTGAWKENKMHGFGVFTWPDGKRYDGEYQFDKKEGQGTFIWPDGSKYEGSWHNNMMHGFGTQEFADGGKSRKGEWRDGRRVRWLE